jgi:hypothetical protein
MKSKKFTMNLRVLSVTFGVGALVGYSVDRARASGVPAVQALTYSGVLTDASGTPLTGSKNIQISVYDMAASGNLQCSAGSAATTLVSGGFRLALPDTCTTAVHATPDLWLEVFVDGTSLGRTKLGVVPFAVEADHAKNADNATSATNAANASSLAAAASGGLINYQVLGSALAARCSGTTIVDCTCPAGTYLVSGGGETARAGAYVRESRPTNTTTWRTTCTDSSGDFPCDVFNLLCSRLGP